MRLGLTTVAAVVLAVLALVASAQVVAGRVE